MKKEYWEISEEEKKELREGEEIILICPFTGEEISLEYCKSFYRGKGCKYIHFCKPIKQKRWK